MAHPPFTVYGYKYAGDHPCAGAWCYVGITIQGIRRRHRNHKAGTKQDIDNFMQACPNHCSGPHIIATPDTEEEMGRLEKHYADTYGTWIPHGFNYRAGDVTTAEVRRKISEANSGDKHYFFGKTHSAETRRKISDANTGANSHWFGKHHTAETLQKMSAANRGQKRSAETRRKMSVAATGRKHTAKSRQKMSVAARLRHQRERQTRENV